MLNQGLMHRNRSNSDRNWTGTIYRLCSELIKLGTVIREDKIGLLELYVSKQRTKTTAYRQVKRRIKKRAREMTVVIQPVKGRNSNEEAKTKNLRGKKERIIHLNLSLIHI